MAVHKVSWIKLGDGSWGMFSAAPLEMDDVAVVVARDGKRTVTLVGEVYPSPKGKGYVASLSTSQLTSDELAAAAEVV